MKAVWKVAKVLLVNVVVLLALFALLEGGASLLFIANQIRRTPSAEASYSRYDETLGWVARPNVSFPNMYGPGVYLRTNSQSFRNDRDFARAVPPGKTRIICSGDSFTLGFGVNNDQPWCQRIAAINPQFETVNLGQGGYGLDQAYLWYMRAGAELDHQVHLFAFITDDFIRMQSDQFLGYGKPVLGIRNDSVVVTNAPVPKTWWFTRWRGNHAHAIGNLNVMNLAGRLFAKPPASEQEVTARNQATQKIVSRVFENLGNTNRQKNSRLVLVYLPGPGDYRINETTATWRAFVQGEASRLGIGYVDMVAVLKRLKPDSAVQLFAPNLHYSVLGNDFVASTLSKELQALLAGRQSTSN
jgi:hypothetical protein